MADEDYGPLTGLIGNWKGDKGNDLAPEPDGKEVNPFYETIEIEGLGVGGVSNAKSQTISALHYYERVYRKSNDEEFHNQSGHWMWDPERKLIMHSLSIPRGVVLIAGGYYNGETDKDGNVVFELRAALGDKDFPIAEGPFMRDKASSTEFTYKATIGKNTFSYTEITMVDIYGEKNFRHVDRNTLVRE